MIAILAEHRAAPLMNCTCGGILEKFCSCAANKLFKTGSPFVEARLIYEIYGIEHTARMQFSLP
jgi:hypothetical protein